jgi:hypothetical protein
LEDLQAGYWGYVQGRKNQREERRTFLRIHLVKIQEVELLHQYSEVGVRCLRIRQSDSENSVVGVLLEVTASSPADFEAESQRRRQKAHLDLHNA